MSKTKHTQGPWALSKTDDYVIEAIKAGSVYSICKYDVDSDNESEDLANARLIAAAPELIEALEGMLKFAPILSNDTAPIEYIRALEAIAKARGEK